MSIRSYWSGTLTWRTDAADGIGDKLATGWVCDRRMHYHRWRRERNRNAEQAGQKANDRSDAYVWDLYVTCHIVAGARVAIGPDRPSSDTRTGISTADNDLPFAPLPIEIDCARMRSMTDPAMSRVLYNSALQCMRDTRACISDAPSYWSRITRQYVTGEAIRAR